MSTFRILDQDGNISNSQYSPSITDEELIKLYTDMLTVSIMDIMMFDAQRQGKISFYMVSAGEEGIAVGSASALSVRDPIFAQYRETGIFQYRGFSLADFMNQLFANKYDPGLGRNMPVHYGSKNLNIHTISSPLATQIPQAAGAAYAVKMQDVFREDKRCVVCYFGEGASSEGDFHAGLNIAATRGCPVVFICRNNGFAISTPTIEQYRGDGIASRGVGYGIDTIRVDGNDILAVREVTKKAKELCLENRPVLIEAMSYRVSHHSTSDDSFTYRAKVEVEDWKRRDNPISRLRKYLEKKNLWNEDKERASRSDIRKEVIEAFKIAEKEKKPAIRNMMEGVYHKLTEEQTEQIQTMNSIMERYPNEYDKSEYET